MPHGERAHAVIDGPNGMAWNYAGSEGWAPCAGHICGLARMTVRSSSAPVHLCPVQGLHRCVSEATVPAGRGASGDRRAHPGVTQSEPGGEEATGARERDRGGRREEGPEAGPRERRAGGPDRLGRVRNGEAGPAAGGVRATGGDNNGAGPAGRPGKARPYSYHRYRRGDLVARWVLVHGKGSSWNIRPPVGGRSRPRGAAAEGRCPPVTGNAVSQASLPGPGGWEGS